MDSRELIDAQFDRAVEVIQSLPKTGPIQTGYDEKLTMYSLYKQATVGNVKGPRPGIFDMLGRAKWDAWAKHKDLDPYEAKWLYVDALLKVLRRYSDATVARDLVRELESYRGDPSNIVMTGSQARTGAHSDSSSEDGHPSSSAFRTALPKPGFPLPSRPSADETTDDDDDQSDDEGADMLSPPQQALSPPRMPMRDEARSPQSAHSARYRSPLAASFHMHTHPSSVPIPATQPHGVVTPSAFTDPSVPHNAGPYTAPLYPSTQHQQYPGPSSSMSLSPHQHQQHQHPTSLSPPSAPAQHVNYRRAPSRPHPLDSLAPRSPSTFALERALEGMQAHIAALSERVDTLETASRSSLALSNALASRQQDFGLWSTAARVLARGLGRLSRMGVDSQSPVLAVARRLFFDLSFVLAMLGLARALWRRSGARRREVVFALRALWWAIIGGRPRSAGRVLVSRGV